MQAQDWRDRVEEKENICYYIPAPWVQSWWVIGGAYRIIAPGLHVRYCCEVVHVMYQVKIGESFTPHTVDQFW